MERVEDVSLDSIETTNHQVTQAPLLTDGMKIGLMDEPLYSIKPEEVTGGYFIPDDGIAHMLYEEVVRKRQDVHGAIRERYLRDQILEGDILVARILGHAEYVGLWQDDVWTHIVFRNGKDGIERLETGHQEVNFYLEIGGFHTGVLRGVHGLGSVK